MNMIQERFLIALLVLALGYGITARSDEAPQAEAPPDPCMTDLTLEKLDNPPERKTKYEVVEEVGKERLVDVKAADQKFVAVVRIKLPRTTGDPFAEINDANYGRQAMALDRPGDRNKELLHLQLLEDTLLLSPHNGLIVVSKMHDSFQRMLSYVPEDRPPSKKEREFLSASIISRYIVQPRERNSRLRELHVLGSTAEEAEQRARALLTMLDQGFSRPLQMGLFKVRITFCEGLREAREKHKAATKSWEMLTARLKGYEEFTPDMLAGLRVQQLQLEVDLAGVKAKIATCEKLLTKMVDLERRKPIEDAKIAAEIELSGFEARRAKSAEFVAKVKERNQITEHHMDAGSSMQNLSQTISYFTHAIHGIDEEIAAFGPVQLVDDRVTIHPLEWTQ
jgi:hypothetical protein